MRANIERPRVLIVEDEGLVAMDIAQCLAETCEVTGIADSSTEAVAQAADKRPDVVLMDIHIRGLLDGIGTAALLQEQFDVPIVYLTAHGDSDTTARARRTNPFGYLLKPFKQVDLVSSVRIAVARHQGVLELRNRERILATTLRSIGEAVLLTDGTGRVTSVNPAAEELLGATARDVAGKNAEALFSLKSQASGLAIPSPVGQVLDTRTKAQLDAAVLTRLDGGERPVCGSAAPILDGELCVGSVLVFRDMTEAMKLQRELEFAARMTSLGVLAAGIAHEINNPLTFILANLDDSIRELDNTTDASEELTQWLREAKGGAQRIATIVGGLRSFSRREENDTLVDLDEVLEWAVVITTHRWGHRAKVMRELDAIPRVQGNASRLRQVFVNLLTNAADAIVAAPARLGLIGLRSYTDAEGFAVIAVSDNGDGIPEAERARIFEPFFTTKRAGAGLGLGLSICHGIVTACGGTLNVTSVVGKGTTFTVRLPPPKKTEAVPTAGLHAVPDTAALTLARRRVLVVDDDDMVRLAMARVLQSHHDVIAVATVDEALTTLAERRVDVVLCDLMMPGRSGIDLYRTVAASHPALLERVAFVTGGAVTPVAMEFLSTVNPPRLEKPFTAASLLALIESLALRS